MSIFDKLRGAVEAGAGNAVKSAVGAMGNQKETFVFESLPESLAELKALPYASLDTDRKSVV